MQVLVQAHVQAQEHTQVQRQVHIHTQAQVRGQVQVREQVQAQGQLQEYRNTVLVLFLLTQTRGHASGETNYCYQTADMRLEPGLGLGLELAKQQVVAPAGARQEGRESEQESSGKAQRGARGCQAIP